MESYTQLTSERRYQIQALLKAEKSQTEIAQIIGVHKSTVSREIARNTGQRGYRPKQAQELADERKLGKSPPRLKEYHWKLIELLLRNDWSPEQISLWLPENDLFNVSHEWIYRHVLEDKRAGGDLYRHLRCKKQRRKRYGSYDRRGRIQNRVSIDERPAIVEERSRIGDWEADLIIGKGHQQAIVSLVERKSRITLLRKVDRKTALNVERAIREALGPLSAQVLTCTFDNGTEFSNHEALANALEAQMYFAHPYSSWERGTNENTNGLVRQYFPKSHDFTTITDEQLYVVQEKLNNRPRKCLMMKTPNQVLFNKHPFVALAA